MITLNDLKAIGSFSRTEKQAASGTLTGALGGAGLGLLVQALRPKDKDQNSLKEYLLSALTGAGLGTAAGFAYDNWDRSQFDPGTGNQNPKGDTIRVPVPDDLKPSDTNTPEAIADRVSQRSVVPQEKLDYLAGVATASHEKHPDAVAWTEAAMQQQDRGVTLGTDGKPKANTPFYITRELVDGIIPFGIAGREDIARRLYAAADRHEIGYRNENGTIFQMVQVPVSWSEQPVLMPDNDNVLFRTRDVSNLDTAGFWLGNRWDDFWARQRRQLGLDK